MLFEAILVMKSMSSVMLFFEKCEAGNMARCRSDDCLVTHSIRIILGDGIEMGLEIIL